MLDNFPDMDRSISAIKILEGDRTQEFKELASALGISQSSESWKELVMDFCLEFKDCFTIITDNQDPEESERDPIVHCFILMRQLGKGKSSMREVTYLQNIADTLAKEFKLIYTHTK
ncbi:hypothetical protein C5F49_03310 [Nitrosopumilus oxyclinae]|uniref:Uncharacterized protein n=1 Tax=Nitrosopumilus oxyclinae TaxID=1959104 RepID=A0A7D5M129_9ARCH|nr:hypothetical protein [Nitrosopumilus oxyclinae]QLH04453.1 hypothetical protein C5F49_03310 [Nitrosopumilus oxyclinae]